MRSTRTGGRVTPSMRGMEKPHTSASTMPTFLPRWARAMARLAVTDDLPTPPFPEATSRTRVLAPGSAKGMVRPSAWPWLAWLPAVASGSPMSWRRTRSWPSSSSTDVSTSTCLTPGTAPTDAWMASRRWSR